MRSLNSAGMFCLYQPEVIDPMAEFLEQNMVWIQAMHEAMDMGLPKWGILLWMELA